MNKCMGLFSTQRLSYEILEIILNVSNATDLETLRTEGFILSVSHWGILAILVFVLYNSCFNFYCYCAQHNKMHSILNHAFFEIDKFS